MGGVYGTRLYGGTDEVPGAFWVATKFYHLNFIPLLPLKSYIILKRDGRSFEGIEIPFDCKSILLAYLRGFATMVTLFVGMFVAMGVDLQEHTEERLDEDWIVIEIFLAVLLVTCLLMWHRSTREPTRERAMELAEILESRRGLEAGRSARRAVNRRFGRNAQYRSIPTADYEEEEEEDEEQPCGAKAESTEDKESDELELCEGQRKELSLVTK